MSVKTFLYLCRLGIKNTWRNKIYTVASVITMTACIFLFGIFYLIVLNVNTEYTTRKRRWRSWFFLMIRRKPAAWTRLGR